jgi:c-di-GMP-related signal transduction protein
VYRARQPILDRNRAMFIYELLYRSGTVNHCDEEDRHRASLELLNDGLFLHGVRELTDDNVLFFNIRGALLDEPIGPREILDLVLAYEQANWDTVQQSVDGLSLREEQVMPLYEQAVTRERGILR